MSDVLDTKALEAGATIEAKWDGREFAALGNADRARYLNRFGAGLSAYLAASPQPANPAQVTDKRAAWLAEAKYDALIEEAKDFSGRMTSQPWACELIERLLDALTAAIGAGGQVVKPLDLSNLLKHAFSAGYVSAAGDDGWTDYDPAKCAAYVRILSALSQPHPADERVVEALTKATGVIDTFIESLSEGLMTDAGLTKADRAAMKHQITALELVKEGISALSAKEGRKNG